MTNLRDIAAAFLDSLAGAQHEANLYSKRLAVQYREDPLLKYFPVPNGLLDEANVTLRFAVPPGADGDERASRLDADTPAADALPSQVAVADLATEAGALLLRDLADALGSVRGASGAAGESTDPIRDRIDALRSSRVARELGSNLHALLGDILTQAMRGTEPSLDALRARLLDVLHASLDGSLADVFDADGRTDAGRASFAAVVDASWEALRGLVDAAAERQRRIQAETARVPSLAVTLDPAALQGVPAEFVQTLTLRAKLRNYKWVLVGEGGRERDELVVTE
ncbi:MULTISPECIES: hypothetical protein [Burkholderia]|uniref:hypothetical protein n=1 Tax=Burkholderia TaxID=32008 RepID=UPI000B79F6A2|nr:MULTISPECIES: hypothetical protein [Burkholderia]MBY4728020.1 hypothetical protein [Burkholderia contaminans]MCI3969211.1 hypothetical protein [Burkholderia sp. HI4860]MDN7787222.1 hypothetical protein [Burkholderia contaminans]OXI98442.1 hypothetical protein CFB48_23885 [Burkholderia sp. AU33647]